MPSAQGTSEGSTYIRAKKTINKIIVTSIIIPILTYGLESFLMSKLNYKYLVP